MIRLALVALLLATASPAAADKAKAEALATEATTAAATGDFRKSAQLFSAAFKEDPRPDLFCNIGISYFKADDWPRAHLLLNRCLDRSALGAATAENVRAVIGSIEQSMRAGDFAPVTINVQDGTRVRLAEYGDDEVFTSTRTVWLGFGIHKVTGQATGYADKTIDITVDKKEPFPVSLELDKLEVVVAPPNPPKARTVRRPGSKVPALIATGGTVIAIVTAAVFNRKAHTLADEALFTFDEDEFENETSTAGTYNNIFGGALVFAAIGAGVSGWLWYRAIRGVEVPVEVAPTTGGASVSFSTRF